MATQKELVARMAKGLVQVLSENPSTPDKIIETAFLNLLQEIQGLEPGEILAPDESIQKAFGIASAALMSVQNTLKALSKENGTLDPYTRGMILGMFMQTSVQIERATRVLSEINL